MKFYLLALTLALTGVFTPNLPKLTRLLLLGGAFGTGAYARHQEEQQFSPRKKWIDSERQFTEDIHHILGIPAYNYEATDNKELPTESNFDIKKWLNDRNRNAHIMIVGKTGAGKSTTAQYLASFVKGKKFVISPHYNAGKIGTSDEEWLSCNGVFGHGRFYYPDDEVENYSYEDIVNGKTPPVSAKGLIEAIYKEMDSRYRSTQDFGEHEVHDWFIDECPAIIAALEKMFTTYLKPIVFEARKVGIRIWLITQSDRVRTLKLEGQGDVRDNFSYVYLADKARQRADKLFKNKQFVKNQRDIIHQTAYPCIIDSTIYRLPTQDETKQVIKNNQPVERFKHLRENKCDSIPTNKLLPKIKPKTLDEALQFKETYLALMSNALDDNLSPSDIINKVWKFNKNYQLGKELYSYLNEKYGVQTDEK